MTSTEKNGNDMGESMFKQVMENWVNPEVQSRQKLGLPPEPMNLHAVQVLFSIDGGKTVRINGEVKAVMKVKLKKGVSVEEGDPVFAKDVREIVFGELLEEDRDFGHITMVRVSDKWHITFSFLYEKSKAQDALNIGTQFLASGKDDLDKNRLGPAVNSLFIASENIANARLVLHPLEENADLKKTKKHSTRKNVINRYSKIGQIIPREFAEAHNQLTKMRDVARYAADSGLDKQEILNIAKTLQSLSDDVRKMLLRTAD